MRAGFFGVLAAALVLGAAAPASDATYDPLVQEFLPRDGFAPGWERSEGARRFTGQDLFNHINGGADLYLEFGFERLYVQSYTDGSAELVLSTYEMEDATAALGVYLMKKGRESSFAEISARNSSEEAQSTILHGRWFIQIDNFGYPAAPRTAVAALANDLLGRIEGEQPAPILEVLPEVDRVPGSERLIRGPIGLMPFFTFGEGDILQLDGTTNGALADYEAADGTTWTQLVVVYPSTDAANAAYDNLQTNLDPYLNVTETRSNGFDFVDFQNKGGSVELVTARLILRFKISELD